MRILRAQQNHPIDSINIKPIEVLAHTPKKMVLTPTYLASTIMTVISSAILATYFVIMGFLIYYAQGWDQKGLVINIFVIGLLVLYVLARMPFHLRLGVVFFLALGTFILNHTVDLPLWIPVHIITIVVLSLGYGQYYLQRRKELIWRKYSQHTTTFSNYQHKGVVGLLDTTDSTTVSKKYFAENTTDELIRRLQSEQEFYNFKNRRVGKTADYIDRVLMLGNNIVLIRSITPSEEDAGSSNDYDPMYALNALNTLKTVFPKYKVSLYYIVYSEDKEYTIPYTNETEENINFIKPHDFKEIHRTLSEGRKILFTKRDDILKMITMSYTDKPDITRHDYYTFTRRV